MKKTVFLLPLLSIQFLFKENFIVALTETLHDVDFCKEADLIKFIEFPYDHRKCLEIVFEGDNKRICMLKFLEVNLIATKISSIESFKHRDISTDAQEKCETFLIFLDNQTDVKNIFKSNHGHGDEKQFFPFSKIYFYFSEKFNESDLTSTHLKTYIIENALFGYVFEKSNDIIKIRSFLTIDSKQGNSSYIPSDLLHPIVDTRLAKDNFRISLFNCKPFTIYQVNASFDTIINEMDGTEFRFVKEVTKNWKKSFILRDFSRTKLSPYTVIMSDLSNRSSDLAMCSVWLLKKHYDHFDLTTFYNCMCSTFLVPTPKKINEATAIYTALSAYVWIVFLWLLFSMWMDISYSTTYTSRLTSPSYEKPINNMKQFLDHDLYVCGQYVSADLFEELRASVNVNYRELGTRSMVYGENEALKRRLIDERKCAIFVNRLSDTYVTMSDDIEAFVPKFRLMHGCTSTHFTGFAFQKNSPYTKLFNWHIRRYQEHGIIQKWYAEFSKEQENYKTIYNDHPEQNPSRRITLVNVSGSFFLLGTGLVLAILSFCIELTFASLINSSRNVFCRKK